jgi:hypothetical protein
MHNPVQSDVWHPYTITAEQAVEVLAGDPWSIFAGSEILFDANPGRYGDGHM